MKELVGILFLGVLPALGASPIPGTQGLNCFEILRVSEGGPAAAANLAPHDLICAVDGIRFGVEHQKNLKEEWQSSCVPCSLTPPRCSDQQGRPGAGTFPPSTPTPRFVGSPPGVFPSVRRSARRRSP